MAMCVVAVALEAHPFWALIVAGNRDELHARPSAPLARWHDNPDIIAGRDLVSGGSWIGVSDTGRFAVVTNIRSADGPDPDKQSRGALITDWLRDGRVSEAIGDYNPFSLITTDRHSALFVSNRPEPATVMLSAGVHGLSNALPDEHWPRKDRLVAELSNWLTGPAIEPRELFDTLTDKAMPDPDAYPLFIRSLVYGTRCSTVIAVDRQGQGKIIERRFDAKGRATGETSIDFAWCI